ncbi:MAG: CBS domain-containing protein [Anaerolineaceae bacterium]|nr:CBS domain-containing protein [Anaerolineaceae bacterium]
MQLTVKEWMKDLVVFLDPDSSVAEALQVMRHRYINSVIVNKTPDNPEYGIVTSIDICDKIVAQQRNPKEVKVREIMNSPLLTVTTQMSLKECAVIMREHHIHHLPVLDEKGQVVGLISPTDFLVVAEAMGSDFQERTLS